MQIGEIENKEFFVEDPLKYENHYYLNHHRCLFRMENSKPKSRLRYYHEYHHFLWRVPFKRSHSDWECKILIQPVNAGNYQFRELFLLRSKVGHFDGIQSYLLSPSYDVNIENK